MAKSAGRLIKWFSILFTASALIIMFTPVSNLVASRLVVSEELKRSDLIVVLGGGAYRNGVLGHASEERLIRGLLLYRDGYAPKVLFSGGALLKPSAKIFHTVFGVNAGDGSKVIESKLMEDTAVKLGLPEKASAADILSNNTYENLKETKKYMEANGLKSCLIVTSPTHMARAALVAKKLGLDFHPAPVRDYTGYRTTAAERVSLFREAAWEYLALLLYGAHGYI